MFEITLNSSNSSKILKAIESIIQKHSKEEFQILNFDLIGPLVVKSLVCQNNLSHVDVNVGLNIFH